MLANGTEFNQVLESLNEARVLGHLTLVGSWALEVYKNQLPSGDIIRTIRTTDVDFAIDAINDNLPKADIHKALDTLGFAAQFDISGLVRYQHPQLLVEFLCTPRKGDPHKVDIPQWNLTAQPLKYLDYLIDSRTMFNYQGISLFVPHPAAFLWHKILVSMLREGKQHSKRQNDVEQAGVLLEVLSVDESQIKEHLNRIIRRLGKKKRQGFIAHLQTLGPEWQPWAERARQMATRQH